MANSKKTRDIVMTALIMCLIMVATFTFKIPVPFTQGYAHLGDTMIFLGVLVLGRNKGALAAGLGSALSDLLGGYVVFSVWTLVIKGLMAFVMGLFIEKMLKKQKKPIRLFGVPLIELFGMIIAGFVMVGGYVVANGFISGNWYSALLSVASNTLQFTVGLVIAWVLSASLYKTPAKKYFAYNISETL